MNKVDVDGLTRMKKRKNLERSAIDSNGTAIKPWTSSEIRTKEIDGTGTVSFPILSILPDSHLTPANQGEPASQDTEVISIELELFYGQLHTFKWR